MYYIKQTPDGVSDVKVTLKGNQLSMAYNRARESYLDKAEVNIDRVAENTILRTNIKLKSRFMKNKLIFSTKVKGTDKYVVVFTDEWNVSYYIHNNNQTHYLSKLVASKSKVLFLGLTKLGIRLIYICVIDNKYNVPIKSTSIVLAGIERQKNFPVFKGLPSKLQMLRSGIFHDYYPLKPLVEGEPLINDAVKVVINIEGGTVTHSLTKGSRWIKSPRWYYATMVRTRLNGYSISFRRGSWGGLVLVRRKLEDIEKTLRFRIYESKLVSFTLYHLAHLVRSLSKKKINIYFEKLSNQAEEGAIDIFRRAREIGESKDFFIINKTAPVYNEIKREKGILKNYTLKSYWIIYRADNIISTEAPSHVNVLRSDNKYIRMACYTQKYVFLQHGVTYLKAHEKGSTFIKDKEGEPDYILVGGKKEKDIVVDMLNLEEERVLNVGLPIFDKIKYSHINKDSDNIVTIMLTWKAYEEHLQDFTKSTYYQTTVAIYEMLKPLIGGENIRIVAHPKFTKLLASTDIADSIWQGSIADVLHETKMLITDYSSVCYNVFYQGGGVVFYQPDLAFYEESNGKLIPSPDEYIGHRVFSERSLKEVVNKAITPQRKIDLKYLRTKQFEKNYSMINEYHDGKNIERLLNKLRELKVI